VFDADAKMAAPNGSEAGLMIHPKATMAPEPGVWGVANTQASSSQGERRTDPRGLADLRVRHLAAGAVLGERTGQSPLDLGHELVARCEAAERVSVLVQDPTGTVRVIEGTAVPAMPEVEGIAVLAKGTTSTLYRVDTAGTLLGILPGFGGAQELADRFHEALSVVPLVRPSTFEGISVQTLAATSTLATPFLVQGPVVDFTTIAAGCLFLATDIEPPGDTVWGYFWAPANSGLVSEFGSMTTIDLRESGARIVEAAQPLSLSDLTNGSLGATRTEAYRSFRTI
jgi:hypothetical protein